MRLTSIRIALIVVSVVTWNDLAAGQPASGTRTPFRRPVTEVCWVDRWQPAECVSIEQLRRVLSKADVERLLATLDRMLARIGGDAAHDALVECHSRPRPVVARIAPQTGPPQRPRALGAADAQRLSSRISGCAGRVASFLGDPGHATDSGRQQWIDDTVAQVDTELAACRDSGDSRIAEDTTERKVKGVIDRSTPSPPKSTKDPSLENSALLVKTKHEASSPGTGTTGSPPPTPPSTPWKEPSPSGIRRGTTSPCPSGADCAPTCEEKQAGWKRFKESCELSHWQAYPCVAFLRKVNGCVDASLINPGPDGDLTCPSRSRATPAQRLRTAWELNCKRRQMFVTPVPGGGDICKRPDEPMPARFDICHDPRAMPSEDQCTGPAGGMQPDGPAPKPQPDPRRPTVLPPPPR